MMMIEDYHFMRHFVSAVSEAMRPTELDHLRKLLQMAKARSVHVAARDEDLDRPRTEYVWVRLIMQNLIIAFISIRYRARLVEYIVDAKLPMRVKPRNIGVQFYREILDYTVDFDEETRILRVS